MHTDIHILAYLQKRMTDAETADFERAVTENPELKANLEAMTLAYLIHEHPDSVYSTTTPISDDTRSFVNNLFAEMEAESLSVPIQEEEKSFYTRYFVPILVGGALLAALIAYFIFTPSAADNPTVPTNTTQQPNSPTNTPESGTQTNDKDTKEVVPVVPPKTSQQTESKKDPNEQLYSTAFAKAKKLENDIKTKQQMYLEKKMCKEKCISNRAAAQADPDRLVFEDLNTLVQSKKGFADKTIVVNEWYRVSSSKLNELQQGTTRLNEFLLKKQCKCD